MPGEVVGTAFVRIKALTDNLAKDIKSEVTKSMKNADLDKVGEDAGKELGGSLGESSMGEAKKTIKKESKGIFQDVADEAKLTSKEISDHLSAGTLRPDFFEDKGTFGNFLDKIKLKLNSADDSFREFSDNIKTRFRSAGDSAQEFFSRTSAGFKNVFKNDKDKGFDDTLQRLGKSLKKFGEGGFTDALGKIPLKIAAIGGAVVGALPFIQDIGSAILSYATGLVAQVGFLVTALGGVGVAAAAAIGSSLTIALPLVLAFKAETEALTEFKDSLAAAGQEFQRIGVATQTTLLPALDSALFLLQDLVEPLSEFGLLVGRAAGNFAFLFANVLVGDEAMGRFQSILQSALRIFDMLIPTAINAGNILSSIWVAAIPASERFVGAISDLVSRWSEMITVGLQTGTLTEKFDVWYDRAAVLGSALSNVAGALFDILEIGANSSDSVFGRFDEWAQRYRDFTESEVGQNRIALIFDNALAVMREVNGVAADLFDGIFGRLGEIGGVDSLVEALQHFREVLPGIQEGFQNMLGPIKEVVEFLLTNLQGKIGRAIDELADPLGRLAHQILDLFAAMEKTGAFDTLLELLKIITDVLSTLLAIPGFGAFIGYMLAFGTAAKIAKIALGPFIGVLGSFTTQIGFMLTALKGQALSEGAGALARFIAGFKGSTAVKAGADAVAAGASKVATSATGMAGSIGSGVAGLGALALPLGIAAGALVVGGIAFYNHQRKVQAWEQEIRQATAALGTLNDGILISTEGIAKYIEETSRFASSHQIDDINRMGFSVENLAGQISSGRISLEEFADAALGAGEIGIFIQTGGSAEQVDTLAFSLQDLQDQFHELSEIDIDTLLRDQTVSIETATGSETFSIDGTILKSFLEMREAISESVKDNIDAFAINTQNVALLGERYLAGLRASINGSTSPEETIAIMKDALNDLGAAAEESSAGLLGVSDETRRMVAEQVAGIADVNAQSVEENRLLLSEQAKVFQAIQADFDLFNSAGFAEEFGNARTAVEVFSAVVDNTDLTGFDFTEAVAGVDGLARNFPEATAAAGNLVEQLQNMPEDQFNAAARVMGADADVLRGAIDGASQAIADLQEAAISTLPTVGSLLDDATGVTEDGQQFFDPDGFMQGARERIDQTTRFADTIEYLTTNVGVEAARIAAEQGPAAAEGLRTLAMGDRDALTNVLADMETAETALTDQIRESLGGPIALEYLAQAQLVGTNTTIGLSQGLNDPVARAALVAAGTDVAEEVARQLNFTFIQTPFGMRAVRVPPVTTTARGTAGSKTFSEGGYVGDGPTFGGLGLGRDTVNAWLEPGEFVLRRAAAQAIPRNILTGLNAGDPRMIGLLTGLSRNRPAGIDSVIATVASTTPARSDTGFVIHQMNIEAPTPLESARQVSDRLRIMQSQLSSR